MDWVALAALLQVGDESGPASASAGMRVFKRIGRQIRAQLVLVFSSDPPQLRRRSYGGGLPAPGKGSKAGFACGLLAAGGWVIYI
jgi:hypothetical protein